MDKAIIDGIYMSKHDIAVGDTIRSEARECGCNIMYAINVGELLNYIIRNKHGVIFIGEDYIKYYDVILEFKESDYFTDLCLVFLDDSLEEVDYSQSNINVWRISSKHIHMVMHDIVGRAILMYRTKINGINYSQVDKYLTDYLRELGFSQKYVGFQYIKESIITAVEKNKNISSYNAEVYPVVAMKNNTQVSNIEKSIRSSIKTAYKSNKELFDNNNFMMEHCISNKTFLTHLLDKTKYEISINDKLKQG